jgi:hypothetical protein
LERQLVEAGDIDGWLAGATRRSYLPDIAGKGSCETTTAESPAACKKSFRYKLQHFYNFHSQIVQL